VAASAVDDLVAAGERRLRALLERLDVGIVAEKDWRPDDPAGESLRDVDVPADLPG
jgi:molybdopterin-guanine dinucleotide biosynthesis protein A